MSKILAIDDESAILALLRNALQKDGHLVTTVEKPSEMNMNKIAEYDLILLDVMMPDIDGFEFCKQIRSIVDCPIIFLTAKTMENDIMVGLGLGADDYITKPFGMGELRARVAAHLRRDNRERHNVLYSGGVKLDLSSKTICIEEEQIGLTKSEYEICEYLARNRGQVFSKDQIYDAVFSLYGESDSSTIAVHIKNARAKMAKYEVSPITTVWGIGYKWV